MALSMRRFSVAIECIGASEGAGLRAEAIDVVAFTFFKKV